MSGLDDTDKRRAKVLGEYLFTEMKDLPRNVWIDVSFVYMRADDGGIVMDKLAAVERNKRKERA